MKQKMNTHAALALVLSTIFVAPSVHALEMGKIVIYSHLAEPLSASVQLGSSEGQPLAAITARIASVSTYASAGVKRPAWADSAQIEARFIDASRVEIRISTNEAVDTPAASLILEIEVAAVGKSMAREYAVMLDPVEAKASSSGSGPGVSSKEKPAAGPSTAKAVGTAPKEKAEEAVTVKNGQVLYAIAKAKAPEGVSVERMMIGVLRANPDAFIGGNINRLKAGAILRMPDRPEIEAVRQADAVAQVNKQAIDFSRQRAGALSAVAPIEQAKAATTAGGQIAPAKAAPDASDVLRLGQAQTGGKGGKGANVSEVDSIAQKKALDESNARVKDLERMRDDLQKLLTLRDKQLAETQKVAAPAAAASANAGSTPAPAVSTTVPVPAPKPAPVATPPVAASPVAPPVAVLAPGALPATAGVPAPGQTPIAAPAPSPAASVPIPGPAASGGDYPAPAVAAVDTVPTPAVPTPAVPASAPVPKPIPKPIPKPVEPPPEPSLMESVVDALSKYGIYLAGLLAVIAAGFYAMSSRRRKEKASLRATTIDPRHSFVAGASPDSDAPSAFDEHIQGADTYLAFGDLDKAEVELNEALQMEPDNLEALIRMARIASKRGDRIELGRLAGIVGDQTFKSGSYWDELEGMLSQQSGAASKVESKSFAQKVEPTDFDALDADFGSDLESSLMSQVAATPSSTMLSPQKSDVTEPVNEVAPMVMNFNLNFPSVPEAEVEAAPVHAPAAALSNEMNFELPSFDSLAPVQVEAQKPLMTQEFSASDFNSLSFDLSLPDDKAPSPMAASVETISFDSTPAASSSAVEADSELSTMFELAKAYAEMDDKEGARELLVEISQKASTPELAAKANALLAEL